MIADNVANAASYYSLSPRIADALRIIQREDVASLPLGRHEFDGERLFALVQEYQTKRPDQTFWETHRRYIDVQYIIAGTEAMGWSPMQQMKMEKPYDPERDIIVWTGEGQRILLPAGNFVIFMPHDAHMGGLLIDEPRPVRKVVLKLAVE